MENRIKQIRKSLKLTQVEFGERLGVKGNTITGYETGLRVPSDAIIMAICREFHINENWLRTGEGEMAAPLSRDEELARFFGELTFSEDSFKRRLILAMTKLDADQWAVLEQVARGLLEETKKTDP